MDIDTPIFPIPIKPIANLDILINIYFFFYIFFQEGINGLRDTTKESKHFETITNY